MCSFTRGAAQWHPEEFLQGCRAREHSQIHYVLSRKFNVWAHTHIYNLSRKLLFHILTSLMFLIPARLYPHHPPGSSGRVQRPSPSLRCLSTLWVLPGEWWVMTSCLLFAYLITLSRSDGKNISDFEQLHPTVYQTIQLHFPFQFDGNLAAIQVCNGQISTWYKPIYIAHVCHHIVLMRWHCNSTVPILWSCITAMTPGTTPTPTLCQDATGWTPALCPCSLSWCGMWWQNTGRPSAGSGQDCQAQVKKSIFLIFSCLHRLIFPYIFWHC